MTNLLKAAIKSVYEARRDRWVHPEGTFDGAGRWYPSDTEDADGFTSSIRSPSRAWPYSYMVAARTKKHVTALIQIALAGGKVPSDISRAVTHELRAEYVGLTPDAPAEAVADMLLEKIS